MEILSVFPRRSDVGWDVNSVHLHRRIGEKSKGIRDAGTDLSDSENIGGTCFERSCDGNRGTDG